MADRFEPRSVSHVVGVLWVVDLPLDSYSIKHWDPLALDQSDLLTSLHIFNTVATDTDRGWCCDVFSIRQPAGNLNIYLTNSTRVIKKPPRVGAGV